MRNESVLREHLPGMPRSTGHPGSFVIQPKAKHTHTAILLHGLGSSGQKFGAEFLESTGLADSLPGMKFVFPTAQRSRSAALKRARINQWFSFASFEDPTSYTDLHGLDESAKRIRSIMEQEMESLAPQNIFLGGLSQGCAMSILVLLGLEFSIGGFIGMSGWLPFEKDFSEIVRSDEDSETDNALTFYRDDEDEVSKDTFLEAVGFAKDVLSFEEANTIRDDTCLGTPIFLGHGGNDEKVRCKFGERAAKTLASLGLDVNWKCYPGLGHWYKIPEEIDDILEFLRGTVDSMSDVPMSVNEDRGTL